MRISDWSSDVCSSDLEARDDDHRSVAPPDLHVTDPVRSPSTRRAGASEEAAGEGLAVARGAGILCAEHLEQVDVALASGLVVLDLVEQAVELSRDVGATRSRVAAASAGGAAAGLGQTGRAASRERVGQSG